MSDKGSAPVPKDNTPQQSTPTQGTKERHRVSADSQTDKSAQRAVARTADATAKKEASGKAAGAASVPGDQGAKTGKTRSSAGKGAVRGQDNQRPQEADDPDPGRKAGKPGADVPADPQKQGGGRLLNEATHARREDNQQARQVDVNAAEQGSRGIDGGIRQPMQTRGRNLTDSQEHSAIRANPDQTRLTKAQRDIRGRKGQPGKDATGHEHIKLTGAQHDIRGRQGQLHVDNVTNRATRGDLNSPTQEVLEKAEQDANDKGAATDRIVTLRSVNQAETGTNKIQERIRSDSNLAEVRKEPEEQLRSTVTGEYHGKPEAGTSEQASDKGKYSREVIDRLHQADQGRKYVFIFPHDNYGRAAEKFVRLYYPDHRLFRVASLEKLFERVATDLRRLAKQDDRPARVSEIVIVTHANKHGVMKVPLTEKDIAGRDHNITRPFAPWYLASLHQEMQAGQHSELIQNRETLKTTLDPQSRIVVRGCEFGQSNDGLRALAAFFGGEVKVFAPTVVQGFELQSVGRGNDPLFASPEQAYDAGARQGLLFPDAQSASPQEKQRTVQRILRMNNGFIPNQFFIQSDAEYQILNELPAQERLSASAEWLKTRTATPDPGLKDYLASLSIEELVDQARALRQDYRREYAPLLLAMQEAWMQRSTTEREAAGYEINPNDPLGGLSPLEIFGDSNLLAADANQVAERVVDVWRSSDEAGIRQAEQGRDPLLSGELKFDAPETDEARRQAEQEFVEDLLNELATLQVIERAYTARGFVHPLPDGGLRLWNFAIGQSDLRDEFTVPLEQIAQRALANPSLQILIEGHASSPGGASRNKEISQARAEAVRQFLIEAGVPGAQIAIQAFGESKLLVDDQSSGGQIDRKRAAQNRQVEVHLEQQSTTPDSTSVTEVDAAVLKTVESSGQMKMIADQVAKFKYDASDPVGDAINSVTLTSDVISHLAELLQVGGVWVFAGLSFISLAGPILDWINFARAAQNQTEVWLSNRRLAGLKLGLEAAARLALEDRVDKNFSVYDLERVVWSHDMLKYEAEELERLGPFARIGGQENRDVIRQGLDKAAGLVNLVLRTCEAEFRKGLTDSGRSRQAVEHEYNAHIQKLRIDCIEVVQRWLDEELKKLNR